MTMSALHAKVGTCALLLPTSTFRLYGVQGPDFQYGESPIPLTVLSLQEGSRSGNVAQARLIKPALTAGGDFCHFVGAT